MNHGKNLENKCFQTIQCFNLVTSGKSANSCTTARHSDRVYQVQHSASESGKIGSGRMQ